MHDMLGMLENPKAPPHFLTLKNLKKIKWRQHALKA
jgi:hypothetical protein